MSVEEGVAHHVYVANLATGEPLTRLTAGDDDWFGLFTHDGTRVLFTSGDGDHYNVFSTRADGGGDVKRLTNSPHWPVRIFERGAWLGPPAPGWGPEWDIGADDDGAR